MGYEGNVSSARVPMGYVKFVRLVGRALKQGKEVTTRLIVFKARLRSEVPRQVSFSSIRRFLSCHVEEASEFVFC